MDAKKIDAKEVVSASKKLSRKDAVALIKAAKKVIVAKGKKVQIFPGGKASKEIVDALLGPTGNLRAPRCGLGKRCWSASMRVLTWTFWIASRRLRLEPCGLHNFQES